MGSLVATLRASFGVVALAAVAATTGCSAAAEDVGSSSGEALSSGFGAFQPGIEGKHGVATDVNLTNAYWMAYSAFALYAANIQGTEQEMRNLANFNPQVFKSFYDPSTAATAYYARLDNVAILAFKGTDFKNVDQYKILLDVGTSKVDNGKAYSGFVSAFHNLWKLPGTDGAGSDNDIRSFILNDEATANVPLYITGHSLGGAFATLAASAIMHDDAFIVNGKQVLEDVYTYGSPRVGDADFSDELTGEMHSQNVGFFRFVNDKDPIPGIIPSYPLSHPGHRMEGLSDYLGALPDGSLITHEADDLVWLDAAGNVSYGEDAQKKLDARWEDPLPSTTDHTTYLTPLQVHQ